MLGFVIGTLCLVGLIKTLRWGRHGYGACHGYGHVGPFGGPFGHCGHHRGWQGGFGGPAFFLRGLFERLETTPGQEKVILAAVEEMREAGRKARGEVAETRKDIARAVRAPGFDEVLLGEMFARHDDAIETLRKAGVGAMAKVHDALDEQQRERLADLVERGPGFYPGFFRAEASL